MECPKCKAVLENDAQYCYLCGSNISTKPIEDNYIVDKKAFQNIYEQTFAPMPASSNTLKNNSKILPLSTAQYIGIIIISFLPIINIFYLISLIIRKKTNINKRNFATAILILFFFCAIITIILLLLYEIYFPSIFTKISGNKIFV